MGLYKFNKAGGPRSERSKVAIMLYKLLVFMHAFFGHPMSQLMAQKARKHPSWCYNGLKLSKLM